ncbi:GerMN domain-containing protein [Nesterenkonia populi]|uniref:GerMN domain-containing protein n=1 Tax=Nesterenkonia populi TaxID=1591087 RepID=UPI0011BFC17F|nr:GerMN domain-containing protein [Nesterenkonia populi]
MPILRLYCPLSAALALTLALTGCGQGQEDDGTAQGVGPEAEQDEGAQDYDNPVPAPEFEDDDSVRLPLGFISPAGQDEAAPLDDGGIGEADDAPGDPFEPQPEQPDPHLTEIARTGSFGCEDRISVVRTTPMVVEDPAEAALEFLLDDQYGQHGSPAFINSLAAASLSLEDVELSGSTVVVELSGQPPTADGCQAWQVLKQIETTARVATGADQAEIRVNGSSLVEQLGIGQDEPLQINEIEPEVDY